MLSLNKIATTQVILFILTAHSTMPVRTISEIEAATRDQAASSVWHNYRRGRVTASKCGDIIHAYSDGFRGNAEKAKATLANSIIRPRYFTSAACAWGKNHEPTAMDAYRQFFGGPEKCKIQDFCGLSLMKSHPHIGCSPDGIATDIATGQRYLLEIKCPLSLSKYKSMDAKYVDPAAPKAGTEEAKAYEENEKKRQKVLKGFYLKKVWKKADGSEHWAIDIGTQQGRSYWYQIQLSLLILDLPYAHFIVWTPKHTVVMAVNRDDSVAEDMVTVLDRFWGEFVVPHEAFSKDLYLRAAEEPSLPTPEDQDEVFEPDIPEPYADGEEEQETPTEPTEPPKKKLKTL